MAFFLNTNSVNDPNSSLNLASLTTMNTANAEQTVNCYGTYEINSSGKWVVTRCSDCTEVSHVLYYDIDSKSTCIKR